MTAKEQFAKQDDVIAAAELGLELLSDADKMTLFMQAEFAGVNRVLDLIDPPRGKKDEKSYRQLLVAAGIECLRRASAIRPVRVNHFTKA